MREVFTDPETKTVGELVAEHGLDQKRFLGALIVHKGIDSPSLAFDGHGTGMTVDQLPVLVNWQLQKYIARHSLAATGEQK